MERKHLLYFFTTDAAPSPFDINMAYDAGFHAVIPYGNVDEERGSLLVQDIIFSRGPKGAKFTALFVGGDDIETAEKVRAAGVEIVTDIDKTPFMEAMVPVYEKHVTNDKLKALVQQIQAVE